MADVDVHWIVRQMIGSDAKDFATPERSSVRRGGVPRRRHLPAAHHRRLRGRSRLAVRSRRRDPRRLRADGRGTKRVSRMRHGSPSASVRPDLHRGQACRASGTSGPHRARARAHSRGSPARRAGADSVRRRESDDGEPAQARPRAFTFRRAREADDGATRSQASCRSRSPTPRCRSRRCRAEISRRS